METLQSSGGIGGIDLEKLLTILNKSLWWIILFVVLSLSGAYLYLRYTKPVYESFSVLKMDIQQRADEILGISKGEGTNLVGELEIIRSPIVYEKVLKKVDLSVTYSQSGNFLSSELYTITPFKVIFEVKNPAFYNIPITLEFIDKKQYILKYELVGVENSEVFKFNTAYENEFLKFKIVLTRFYNAECNGTKYIFVLNSKQSQMEFLGKGVNAYILNPAANTIRIAFQDNSPQKASDIVNAIDTIYKEQTLVQKNLANEQTLKFLEIQMENTSRKLNQSEQEVQDFIRRNKITDINSSAEKLRSKMDEIILKKEQMTLQEAQLDELDQLVATYKQGQKQVFPSLNYINDPNLVDLAKQLNSLLQNQTLILYNAKESTAAYRISSKRIEELRKDITEIIAHDREMLRERVVELNMQLARLEAEYLNFPNIDKELTQIKRYLAIHEKYYQMFIERKAEFEIAKAGTIPNFQILAPATIPTIPLIPQKGSVYSTWIIIGVISGIALIIVRYLLQDTVVSQKELEQNAVAPVLGVVPVYTKEKLRIARLVVDKNPKSAISESLRSIRTNIDFIVPEKKKIISITSTVAGEGKTFFAINLGGV
ncbi:MAG TPA: Wzz/FepE/Etk N-terminal domain-containing protein, partial [Catalimonadaceae bacterium]|nr:Wzz/FepE/Etk N-terminal domain-containing protein [Catalimonadaceae bacterium]